MNPYTTSREGFSEHVPNTDSLKANLDLPTWKLNALEMVEQYPDPHEAREMLSRKLQAALTSPGMRDVDWAELAFYIFQEARL